MPAENNQPIKTCTFGHIHESKLLTPNRTVLFRARSFTNKKSMTHDQGTCMHKFPVQDSQVHVTIITPSKMHLFSYAVHTMICVVNV